MGDYIVERGDTLAEVAARFEISLQELLEENEQLVDPNVLRPGDVIHVPGAMFRADEYQGATSASATGVAAVQGPHVIPVAGAGYDPAWGVTVEQRVPPTSGSFDVAQVAFQNDENAQGNHNVYVRVLGPDGQPIPPQYLEVMFAPGGPEWGEHPANPKNHPNDVIPQGAWTNGERVGALQTGYFDAPLAGDDRMTVWVRPAQIPDNPYAGFGTQQVGPFTMPGHHHVNWLVTFQARGAGAPSVALPPAASSQPPSAAAAQPASVPSDLEELINSVYLSELGRNAEDYHAAHTTGIGHWMRYAKRLADKGVAPEDIRQWLVDEFHKTPEYKARLASGAVGAGANPPPAAVDGSVPVAPTSGPPAAPGSVYSPFEVAPGVFVNGRLGAHWFSDTWGNSAERADEALDRMQQLGVKYCTLLVDPGRPEAMYPVIEKMMAKGITPVVRLYVGDAPDTWSGEQIAQMGEAAHKLAALGVKLIQVGNEPNIEGRLSARGMNDERGLETYLANSTRRLVDALVAVQAAVGDSAAIGLAPMACGAGDVPSLGVLSPSRYFTRLCQEVAAREEQTGLRLVDWLSTHTYSMGEPGSATTPDTARGNLGWGPTSSAWYEAQAAAILGRDLTALSTEGGAEPNAFLKGNGALVTRQMDEAYAQLAQNAGTTNCLWLLYGDGESWNRNALADGEAAWTDALAAYRARAPR